MNEKQGKSVAVFSSDEAFETGQRIAKALGKSDLVPAAYKGDKGLPNTLIALELAARIGASPLMVMQNLHVIQGRPSWSSSFLIATVNASGKFSPLRFRYEGEPGTESYGCRAYATDADTGEECVGSLITMRMAKDEGWSTKSGSKWKTMPEQMLMYRAAAFWTRVYAPELSLGMHTVEEMMDISAGRASSATADLNAALEGEGVLVAEVVDEETGEISEPEDDGPSFDEREALEAEAQGKML